MINNPWHDFLLSHGATGIVDGYPCFPPAGIEHPDTLCDLSALAAIRVDGPDATKFLHNQLTSNIVRLEVGCWQLSAWCSPKGRVLAVLRVLHVDTESYLLLVPRSELDRLQRRLRLFVLRSKVTLSSESDGAQVIIGVIGERITKRLFERIGPSLTPNAQKLLRTAEGLVVASERGAPPRYCVYGPRHLIEPIWAQLAADSDVTDYGRWRLANILAGLPEVSESTVDQFLPQMLNLDVLGAVDFDKGCYPGQEIVARTKYLGRLKRRTVRGHSTSPATSGIDLWDPEHGNAKVGTVLSSEPHPEGETVSLAVVSTDVTNGSSLRFESGAEMVVETLVSP